MNVFDAVPIEIDETIQSMLQQFYVFLMKYSNMPMLKL